MTAREKRPNLEENAGYVFSQVSGAIVGGIVLCIAVSAVLDLVFRKEMTIGAVAFTTLLCIPMAWGVRALIDWIRGR